MIYVQRILQWIVIVGMWAGLCQACNPSDANTCTSELSDAVHAGISVPDVFCKPLNKLDDIKGCVLNAIGTCTTELVQQYNAVVEKNASVITQNSRFCHSGCTKWLDEYLQMQACQAFGARDPSNPCSGPRQAAACAWNSAKGCPYLEEQFVNIMGHALARANEYDGCALSYPGVVLPTVAPTPAPPVCALDQWEDCVAELKAAVNAGPVQTEITCPMLTKISNVELCSSAAVTGCNGTLTLDRVTRVKKMVSQLQQNEKYCAPGCADWFQRYLQMQGCVSRYGSAEIPNNPCGPIRQTSSCAFNEVKGCPYLVEEFIRILGFAIAQKNKDHNCAINVEGVNLPRIPENDCAVIMDKCNLYNETLLAQETGSLPEHTLRRICRDESCMRSQAPYCKTEDIAQLYEAMKGCEKYNRTPPTRPGFIASGERIEPSVLSVAMLLIGKLVSS